jgi:uncharacterized protein YciI
VKYVLFYESAEGAMEKAPLHFAEHQVYFDGFHARGALLMLGPFGNPQDEGSMAIFTTRDAAEEFAAGDPFVLNGVVGNWYIRAWHEALVPD